MGWLAYSDNELNCNVLVAAIQQHIKLEQECCWHVISIGKKGPTIKEERVQAIHLIVDHTKREKAEDLLCDSNSFKARCFCLGITMHLVPEMDNFTDPKTAAKCPELWARQRAFMACMKKRVVLGNCFTLSPR
ncbi:hypothetical protein ACA910_009726 [Epithemia clementina (nom. ined.)]